MSVPFNPNALSFPIYWFPIIIPLAVTAFGVMGDAMASAADGRTVVWFPSTAALYLSVLKNVNLSFMSTDLWALTTVVVYTAKGTLSGIHTWALTLGIILGVFFHLLSYLFIAIINSFTWAPLVGSVVVVVGAFGLLLIRDSVYQQIEIEEIEELTPDMTATDSD